MSIRRCSAAVMLAIASSLPVSSAIAAGFDTPILYTARHQGMGGAAIAYVDDPSAMFHNPAGLQGVRGLAFLGDVSLLMAHVTGSPGASASATGIQSQLTVAPFFMAAAAYRAASWLSAGLAIFPVASGGAEYEYPVPESEVYQHNATNIVFYELTPAVSLNVPEDAGLPGALSFGIGYRMHFVTFERQQGEIENPNVLDLDANGFGLKGLRAGMQYRVDELFSFGVVFRNRVTVTTKADQATVLGNTASDVELPFTLPAQLGGGFRSDFSRLGVAFDAIYTFQSQNESADLSGTIGGNRVAVPNVFNWRNAFTLRFGVEYRLGPDEQLPLRIGYIYDDRVSSRAYPSPFNTPPTPTRTFTLGGGYDTGPWELNLALALRNGDTSLSPTELAPRESCPTCGYAGQYAIDMTGFYVDFSTDLEL